jgi:hypothetical protein
MFSNELDDSDLLDLFGELGVFVQYRQSYAATAQPNANLTAGTDISRPIGTRGTGFDPTEGAIVDSTVDAATGFVGGYGPAQQVVVLFTVTGPPNKAGILPYGSELAESDLFVYLLARYLAPVRGDLLIHPNGERYVVGEQQQRIGLPDRPIAYLVAVEHRTDHADPVYTV